MSDFDIFEKNAIDELLAYLYNLHKENLYSESDFENVSISVLYKTRYTAIFKTKSVPLEMYKVLYWEDDDMYTVEKIEYV